MFYYFDLFGSLLYEEVYIQKSFKLTHMMSQFTFIPHIVAAIYLIVIKRPHDFIMSVYCIVLRKCGIDAIWLIFYS